MTYVSHTECNRMAVCPRRHYYANVLRLIPREPSPPLLQGSTLHAVAERVHLALMEGMITWDEIDNDVLDAWLTEAVGTFYGEGEDEAAQKCYDVLVDSLHVWRAHEEVNQLYTLYDVVAAEEQRFWPIPGTELIPGEGDLELKAIADVVLQHRNSGDQVLGEYKAWSDMRDLDALGLDDQHRRYMMAWPETVGCFFIAVKRAGPRAKADAGVRWMARDNKAQARALARLASVARAAAISKEMGERPRDMPPMNLGFHCKRCDYRTVCALSAQGFDATAERMLETGTVHDPGRSVREPGR